MANGSKSLVIYSDIHDGSTTAICSKDPITSDKNTTYRPNNLQKSLYQAWVESIDALTQKPNAVVINGEPIDGANSKQLGNQSWTTNINDQINDSAKIINLIPRKSNLFFIRGSGYHVDKEGTNYESTLADKVKATKYRVFKGEIEKESDYYANIKMNGKLFSFTHHIGFNRWAAYRTTALAREMAAMHFEKDKLLPYDIIVRSHVHYFVHVRFVHTFGFTTPAWKFPDGHLFRGGLGGTTPDIGSVEVIVESNGKVLIEPHIMKLKLPQDVYEIA